MAERKVFSVFDVKSELFSPPFYMTSRGEAVRAFKDLANDANTTVGRHPSDFKLVYLGLFDEETGQFENAQQESLGFAIDYVALPSGSIPLGVVKGA